MARIILKRFNQTLILSYNINKWKWTPRNLENELKRFSLHVQQTFLLLSTIFLYLTFVWDTINGVGKLGWWALWHNQPPLLPSPELIKICRNNWELHRIQPPYFGEIYSARLVSPLFSTLYVQIWGLFSSTLTCLFNIKKSTSTLTFQQDSSNLWLIWAQIEGIFLFVIS